MFVFLRKNDFHLGIDIHGQPIFKGVADDFGKAFLFHEGDDPSLIVEIFFGGREAKYYIFMTIYRKNSLYCV